MPDGILINGSNFNTIASNSPATVGQAFSDQIQIQSTNMDVFGQMEGPENSGLPFCIKTDLRAGRGNVVNFTTLAQLSARGRLGEQQQVGYEEKPRFGSYPCRVDFIRNAVGLTQKMLAFLATGKTLEEVYAQLLGDWFGRKKQSDMMIMLRSMAGVRNTYNVNGKSFNNLLSTDTMSTSVITGAKTQLTTLGAKSCNLAKGARSGRKSNTGAEIKEYLLFGSNVLLQSLQSNSSYLTAEQFAAERGDANTIFAGGYTRWNGVGIYEYSVADPDGGGPLGAPIIPRALLGAPITAGTTAVTLTGGGVAAVDTTQCPFDWFLGYDYQYFEEQDPNPDNATYYCIVLNTTGSDVGKFGVYSYVGSGNNGQTIVTTNRLGPAATGAAVTTLAGYTYDSTKNTNAHPTGSLIWQINAKGTSIGWAYMFGQMAAVRAYGNLGGEDSGKTMAVKTELGDYGMKKGRAMVTCYGQSPAVDTLGVPRNYVLIPCAVNHPEAPAAMTITS